MRAAWLSDHSEKRNALSFRISLAEEVTYEQWCYYK